MPSDLNAILSLEVPIIVQMGRRAMRMSEVVALVPGAIIEIPKRPEDELSLLVNNKQIGAGVAVKVGENYGIRISYIGDVRSRIAALGGGGTGGTAPGTAQEPPASLASSGELLDSEATLMADAMLSEQA